MGGSRRRLKKGKPKVRVGVVKRKKNVKAEVPLEVLNGRPDLAKRLNTRCARAHAPACTHNEQRAVVCHGRAAHAGAAAAHSLARTTSTWRLPCCAARHCLLPAQR